MFNILLSTDDKSDSGGGFIKTEGRNYDFSEYRMKLVKKTSLESDNYINLRKAEKSDRKEIGRQDAIFFSDEEELKSSNSENGIKSHFSEEWILVEDAYMIEFDGKIIGKINIEYTDSSAFIFGFGILPKYRGKGYGKAALKKALNLINDKNITEVSLDVGCKNESAFNLYKACGFQEVSIMNYYKYR